MRSSGLTAFSYQMGWVVGAVGPAVDIRVWPGSGLMGDSAYVAGGLGI